MTEIPKDVHDKAQEPMAWFQHDANAQRDIKCQRLLMRRGNEGYGAYWRLCELLASTKHHSIAVDTDEDWLILAGAIGMRSMGAFDETVSIAETQDFIDCLLEIGLLVRDGKGRIESERMCKNALFLASSASTEPRAAGRKRSRKTRKTSRSERMFVLLRIETSAKPSVLGWAKPNNT